MSGAYGDTIRVQHERVRKLAERPFARGPVFYWMSRDQRVRDNWALLYAQHLALEHETPLGVVFCLVSEFLGATLRQYDFMLRGLEQVERDLRALNIPFYLIEGDPGVELPRFCAEHRAGALGTDFDPLKLKEAWKVRVAQALPIPFREVDAHNIVPCWHASSKQEYGAYTLRPKLGRLVPDFLVDFPEPMKQPKRLKAPRTDWKAVRTRLRVDSAVSPITWLEPGERAARAALEQFAANKLDRYDETSNDPAAHGQSDLSPYLHFGQLSAQRVALEVSRTESPGKAGFLEQLIVRRELSDNFCHYNAGYDTFLGIPTWARATLDAHRNDPRPYLYSMARFEAGETHDPLWNAAQREMVRRGKMHGYLRMYWAKKILEWTREPEEAFRIALALNDKYELDGRDPNGYTGIAWSLGGVHDRAWTERPVFGKIRYMNEAGCRRKFDVNAYIDWVRTLPG